MQDSNVPAKPPIPFANGAGGAHIRTIPTPSQIAVTPGAASLTDGFPPLTFLPEAAGGIPPFGQDMNGILNLLSAWARWQAAGGPNYYDPTFSSGIGGYPKGSLLNNASTAGFFWVCTVDNNLTDPDTGGSGWVPLGGGGGAAAYGLSALSYFVGEL